MQIVAKGATEFLASVEYVDIFIPSLPVPVNFLQVSHALLSDIQRRDPASEIKRRYVIMVGKQEATI